MTSIHWWAAVLNGIALLAGHWQARPIEKAEAGEMRIGHPMTGVVEEKRIGDLTLILTTLPERPKAGEPVFRLRLLETQSGKPVEDAEVTFRFTQFVQTMMVREVRAAPAGAGVYEAKAELGTPGQWEIFVDIQRPGRAVQREQFRVWLGETSR